MKMKVLNPQYMGYNPSNEGCGFPWSTPYLAPGNCNSAEIQVQAVPNAS